MTPSGTAPNIAVPSHGLDMSLGWDLTFVPSYAMMRTVKERSCVLDWTVD